MVTCLAFVCGNATIAAGSVISVTTAVGVATRLVPLT